MASRSGDGNLLDMYHSQQQSSYARPHDHNGVGKGPEDGAGHYSGVASTSRSNGALASSSSATSISGFESVVPGPGTGRVRSAIACTLCRRREFAGMPLFNLETKLTRCTPGEEKMKCEGLSAPGGQCKR